MTDKDKLSLLIVAFIVIGLVIRVIYLERKTKKAEIQAGDLHRKETHRLMSEMNSMTKFGKHGFYFSLCTNDFGLRYAKLSIKSTEPNERIEFPMDWQSVLNMRDQLNHVLAYVSQPFGSDEPETDKEDNKQ